MLIRDNIGDSIKQTLDEQKEKKFEIVSLETDEEFFQAIVQKIRDEIEMLHLTKSVDNLAEVVELIEWLQISLGMSHLSDVIEYRKEKLGLYWKKYYIKDIEQEPKE